jgi:acyl-CoA synthetase (AMP-forming)/AMP-acid ligase II
VDAGAPPSAAESGEPPAGVPARGDLAWDSVPALARDACERFSAREAIVDGDVRVTFADLGAAIDAAARAFVAAGVEAGDRVAVWAPNCLEWVVALVGLHAAGGVLVPLNTRFRGVEAAYVLQRSRAVLLCTVRGFLGTDYIDLLAGHECPHLRQIIVLRGDAGDPPYGPPAGSVTWDSFLSAGSAVEPAEVGRRVDKLNGADLSDVIFTSGTTGAPKGVVSTHGQTLRAYAEWVSIVGLRAGDRYLIVNPMFHTFGYKAGIVASLMAGATMVPLPLFDVEAVIETVARERITVLPGPPTLYQSLLAHPRRSELDRSTLRLAVTGAAVIPVELVRRMRAELGFETVLTAYGLTEATGFVTACRRGDDLATIAATSGRAIDGVEVMVVGEGGGEVPRGEAGEIVCRGYNVMRGYLEDMEQTAATIDKDGWLHTGDVGVMDEGGNINITDRKKDMFIVGGFNAYPAEIENLLLGHPGVARVAVVGIGDGRLGEVGVAFVVPEAGVTLVPAEIIEWGRDVMANFKVPRHVIVVDALPLNASGKVLKYELRRRASEDGILSS